MVAWDGCSVTRLAKDVAAKLWPPVAARCQQVRNGRGTIRGRRCGPRVLRLRFSCSSCSSRTGTPTRRSAQRRISLGATRCVLVADWSVTVTGKVHGSVQRAVCRPVLAHLSRIGRRAASTSCQRSGWHCCLSRFHLWLMRSRCLRPQRAGNPLHQPSPATRIAAISRRPSVPLSSLVEASQLHPSRLVDGRLRLHRHATPGVAPNLHHFRGR